MNPKKYINKGIFTLFCLKMDMSLLDLKRLLSDYNQDVLKIEVPKNKSKMPKRISTIVNENRETFDRFMKYFYENKKKYCCGYLKKFDYHDWYMESSLDGSFAYNNSADDF